MNNPYEWWLKKLAGEVVEVSADNPQAGFYRKKGKGDRPWLPVALWWDGPKDEEGELIDDARLVCNKGFAHDAEEVDPQEIWTWIADQPVTEEAYRAAFETGAWPDDAPRRRDGIGGNLPEDPLSAVEAELEGEIEVVAEFLRKPVETQADADKIGPWTKRILALRQRAERLHDEEKRPYLDAGKVVDDKWRLPIAEAAELVKKLRDHLQPFLTKQKRAEDERTRAAAAEAARLRAEAEKNARSEAQREDLLRQASDQEQKAIPQKVSAGRTGAKVSLRKERRPRVTDYRAAANALLDLDGPISADLRDRIDVLVARVVKSGFTPPGVEVEEFEFAR